MGARLKQLRQSQGLSQRALAALAGITHGNLSNIENGLVSPAVATLQKILAALGTHLQAFFQDAPPLAPAVVPLQQLMQVLNKGVLYRVLPVPEAQPQSVHLVYQQLPPHTSTRQDWWPHSLALAGFVVSGQLNLVLDGGAVLLHPGDAFHFSVSRSFCFQNATSVPCELALVSLGDNRDAKQKSGC